MTVSTDLGAPAAFMVDQSQATRSGGDGGEEQGDGGDGGARETAAEGAVEQEAGEGEQRG